MAQFVLVHGAWHGAWCWKRVLPILRAAGHDAHTVSLTGVGERYEVKIKAADNLPVRGFLRPILHIGNSLDRQRM